MAEKEDQGQTKKADVQKKVKKALETKRNEETVFTSLRTKQVISFEEEAQIRQEADSSTRASKLLSIIGDNQSKLDTLSEFISSVKHEDEAYQRGLARQSISESDNQKLTVANKTGFLLSRVIIWNLINFKGENDIPFEKNERPLSRLFAIIGENNTGKTSLFTLIRTATDVNFWRSHWAEITPFEKKESGTVVCEMVEEVKAGLLQHLLGVHYFTANGQKTSVAFWLKSNGDMHTCQATTNNSGIYEQRMLSQVQFNESRTKNLDSVLKSVIQCIEKKEGLQDSHSPWDCYAPCLPKFLCDPDARQQVEEYLIDKKGEGSAEKPLRHASVDEKNKIMKHVTQILQGSGYEHYHIEIVSSKIMIKNKRNGKEFPLSALPGGHQYLLNIALNVALSTNPSGSASRCLLIDEPTCQMHPVLAGEVSWFIRGCCRDYSLQVIFITHSPHALRPLYLENIFRCRRLPGEQTQIEVLNVPSEVAKAIEQNRMEEILFSEIVFQTEGESDRRLMDALLKTIGYEATNTGQMPKYFDKILSTGDPYDHVDQIRSLLRNMLVVSVSGKGNRVSTRNLLNKLGIPFFSLLDGDAFVGFNWAAKDFREIKKTKMIETLLNKLRIPEEDFLHSGKDAVSVSALKEVCNQGIDCSLSSQELTLVDQWAQKDKGFGQYRLQALKKKFEKLHSKLETTQKLELLQSTAECRHLIYTSKIKAAKSVEAKLKLLADFLGKDMLQNTTDEEQIHKLFRDYLELCQAISRCYVWKYGLGEKNTYDLESFTREYGKEIGKHTNCSQEVIVDTAQTIYKHHNHSGNDYEGLLKFLFMQVLPYLRGKHEVSSLEDKPWSGIKPALKLELHAREAEKNTTESFSVDLKWEACADDNQ